MIKNLDLFNVLLYKIQPETSSNPGVQFAWKFFAERTDAQLSCQLHWTQPRRLTGPGSRSIVQISLPEDQHDVSGSLALGNPARSQCSSKVHKVNYNSFHSKKFTSQFFRSSQIWQNGQLGFSLSEAHVQQLDRLAY